MFKKIRKNDPNILRINDCFYLLSQTFSTQLFQVVLKITTIDIWKTEKGYELGQFYLVPKAKNFLLIYMQVDIQCYRPQYGQ